MLHLLLLPFSYDKTGIHSPSLLDAVRDGEILNYIELGYSSFFSANTSPTSLLFDALIASDEASFASFETKETRIQWVNHESLAIPHVVLGSSPFPGGQWSSGNTPDDSEEKSLSYAEMLSLPGYSFTEFFHSSKHSLDGSLSFARPKRGDIAKYYGEYPKKMNLMQSFRSNTVVTSVSLQSSNVCNLTRSSQYKVTYVDLTDKSKHTLDSKLVVLASGVFEKPLKDIFRRKEKICPLLNNSYETALLPTGVQLFRSDTNIPIVAPPDNFRKITTMEPSIIMPLNPPPPASQQTVLILGSGVSAAEAVNHCALHSNVHVVHLYRWFDDNPGPLRRFSRETYPEYSRVYRLMKQYVKNQGGEAMIPDFFKKTSTYEGLPNCSIIEMSPSGKVTLELQSGKLVTRYVSQIKLCTGRSGSLAYLSSDVCKLVGFSTPRADLILSPQDSTEEFNLDAVSKTSLSPYLALNKSNSSLNLKLKLGSDISSSDTLNTINPATSGVMCTAEAPTTETTPSSSSTCCDDQSIACECCSDSCIDGSAASSVSVEDYDVNDYRESCAELPGYNLRLGPGLYAIGSLTGESLVRLMLGGCAWVAGDIFTRELEIERRRNGEERV